MARSVERLQPQLSDDQQFTALQTQIDEWRRTCGMHHYRHTELARELLRCREMICVRMGIDGIPDTQTLSCGQRDVAVDLPEFRVD